MDTNQNNDRIDVSKLSPDELAAIDYAPKIMKIEEHRNPRLKGKAMSARIGQKYLDVFEIVHSALYSETRKEIRTRKCFATVAADQSEEQLNAQLKDMTVQRIVGLRKESVMSATQLGWYLRYKDDPSLSDDGEHTWKERVAEFYAGWLNSAAVMNPNTKKLSQYKGYQKYQRFALVRGHVDGELDLCEQDYQRLTGDITDIADADIVDAEVIEETA